MLDTVKKLCALPGVSGWEDEVRDRILEQAMPHADEIGTDALGNLYIFKKGALTPAKPLMVCAHMDEVGLIVTNIDEDGYLRFDFVGGVDRRVVLGKRVFIGPDAVPGVVGLKAIHLTDAEERSSVPKTESLRVDIGAENAEAAKKIYRAKGRPSDNPLIVHLAEPEEAERYCVTGPLYEKLAARFFHPEEREALNAEKDPEAWQRLFARIWTRKESRVKADGTGISAPFSGFSALGDGGGYFYEDFFEDSPSGPVYSYSCCLPERPGSVLWRRVDLKEAFGPPER